MSTSNGQRPRAAIYARVSTPQQHPKNPIRELQAFAHRHGYKLTYELVDKETGQDRVNLLKLIEATRSPPEAAQMPTSFALVGGRRARLAACREKPWPGKPGSTVPMRAASSTASATRPG